MAISDGLGLSAGGFLNSFNLGISESLFARFADPCSLGGVDFYIIDSREQVGRRIQRQLFPGSDVDSQVFQDFGNLNTPIHMTGLIYGTDYVAVAKRMSDVLQSEGALILLHPWYGRLKVRIAEPASISFRHDQVRLASFEVNLYRDEMPVPVKGFFGNISDSLDNLFKTASALGDAARNAVGIALGAASIPLAVAGSVRSAISVTKGIYDTITKTAPESIQSAVSDSISFMNTEIAPAQNTNSDYANQVSHSLSQTPDAIGGSLPNQEQPMTAPASGAPAIQKSDVTAAQIGDLLISIAQKVSENSRDYAEISPSAGTVLLLSCVTQIYCAINLMSAWSGLSFKSNAECETYAEKYAAVLDQIQKDLELTANSGAAAPLSGMLSKAADLQNALSIDSSNKIGRLPSVISLPIKQRTSLFLIANALSGDNPQEIMTSFEDMHGRNGIKHTALAQGNLEALDV